MEYKMARNYVTVKLDKTRKLSFSWAAIEYLTDRYDSVGQAITLVASIDDMSAITKKSLQAVLDVMAALLVAEDPDMTSDKVKDIMPLNRMSDYMGLIAEALQKGQAKGGDEENPQTPA